PDQLDEKIRRIEASRFLRMQGVHVHIGSQIQTTAPFAEAVQRLATLGEFAEYNVGGGLGVRYTRDEKVASVDEYLDAITTAARDHLPRDARLIIEPGRSMVARAVVTLYTVVTKKSTGRHFVAVDGGMGDNLEGSLTGQPFEACVATRLDGNDDQRYELVGRHCESGDRIASGVSLQNPTVGDTIAVPVTGAYTYTLANNYNGALRAPVVFCNDGQARLVARRETYSDLLRLHEPVLGDVGMAR
ncbi:MAG: diaminopimelate decarboxylase family protein, partial [Nocardioidaceae bacterium]